MRTQLSVALLSIALLPAAVRAQTPAEPPPLPSITLPAELNRVLRDYERLWRAGDEAGLAAIFTEDGFVPGRTGWWRGRDAIRGAYQTASGELNLRALAYATSDTVGYIIGAFRYGTDASAADNGKFVLALRRATRTSPWLIAADLDSANRR
jgi:uncharacterized protein (TIGR02246 family)